MQQFYSQSRVTHRFKAKKCESKQWLNWFSAANPLRVNESSLSGQSLKVGDHHHHWKTKHLKQLKHLHIEGSKVKQHL